MVLWIKSILIHIQGLGFYGFVVIVKPIGVGIAAADHEFFAVLIEGGAVVLEIDMVFGEAEDFDFSGAMGHDIAGPFGQSGDAGFGLGEDFVSGFDGYGVAFVAGGGSALENIVGGNADERKFLEQIGQGFDVVVNAADERSLVGDNSAGALKGLETLTGKIGKFVGVVEMNNDIKLFAGATTFLDQIEQGRIIQDAIGIESGHFGADADNFDMIVRQDRVKIFFELGRRQSQRIAAGDENIGDFTVFFEVLGGGGQVGEDFFLAIDENSFAEAVATNTTADITD